MPRLERSQTAGHEILEIQTARPYRPYDRLILRNSKGWTIWTVLRCEPARDGPSPCAVHLAAESTAGAGDRGAESSVLRRRRSELSVVRSNVRGHTSKVMSDPLRIAVSEPARSLKSLAYPGTFQFDMLPCEELERLQHWREVR